jgi:hypothetical protein
MVAVLFDINALQAFVVALLSLTIKIWNSNSLFATANLNIIVPGTWARKLWQSTASCGASQK